MRDPRFAIGRFVVLALVLAHWVGTSPSTLTRVVTGYPSLDRLDPQSVASHRAPTAVSVKQSPVDRLPHAPAGDAAAVPAADSHGIRSGSTVEDLLERAVPAFAPAYRARGPPIA